jgi:hypothetical protein
MAKKVVKSLKDLDENKNCEHRFFFDKDKAGNITYNCIRCKKRMTRKEYAEYNRLKSINKDTVKSQ